jgi:hypothetical protein
MFLCGHFKEVCIIVLFARSTHHNSPLSRILPPAHCVVSTTRSSIPRSQLLLFFFASFTTNVDQSQADNRNNDIQWELRAQGVKYAFTSRRTVPFHQGPRIFSARVHESVDSRALRVSDHVYLRMFSAHAFSFRSYMEIE